MEVDVNVQCFVFTTLPEFDYKIGIESHLKKDIEKYTLRANHIDI